MSFENSAGLGVNNHFGPRTTGGTQGVYNTDGYEGEFTWEIGEDLGSLFPRNVEVIGVDQTFATGTITALTIGGVDVIAATEAAPVGVVPANTGVLAQTGGTDGVVVVKYKKAPGGITVA